MWAIVVAGGSGRRFGGPKQFLPLAGRPVAAWSVPAARTVADGVVLVVPDPSGDARRPSTTPIPAPGRRRRMPMPGWGADCVVAGGAARADSVRAGLAAVPDDATVIVVHDAARPLACPDSVRRRGRAPCGPAAPTGAIPVLAVSDTLKRIVGGPGGGRPSTATAWSTVQTPQAFAAAALRAAHAVRGPGHRRRRPAGAAGLRRCGPCPATRGT